VIGIPVVRLARRRANKTGGASAGQARVGPRSRSGRPCSRTACFRTRTRFRH
jgi:hypothetical protein